MTAEPGGVQRGSVRSSGLEATMELLNRVYPSRVRLVGRHRDNGSLALSTADCRGVGADRCRMEMRFDALTDPWTDLTAIWLVKGRLGLGDRNGEHTLMAGDSFLYSIKDVMQFRAQPLELVVVRVAQEDVARVAARHFGVVPADLWPTAGRPVSRAMNTHWQILTGSVRKALAVAPSVAEHPLIAGQLLEYVAASMLTVFPNATMQLSHVPSPGAVGTATLRRAVAYVDAHAGEPITVEDIASAAGTSSRALQYAFRRHLACTPREYLRRVRLERAHRDLQDADPSRGDTVAAVALRWGFTSTGWFGRHYRAAYGRAPGETLRENC
ncbi:AraC family transcriptional regulator [Kribbella sp. HUAS MG21]|uniref:AraC family transcriptional regulator n=1 Tax=Kribbella sp. HUAS MG21 TaxID=3160966 RepID=A0AAU7TF85_9ACTN